MVVWCTFNVDSGDMKNQNKDSDEGMFETMSNQHVFHVIMKHPLTISGSLLTLQYITVRQIPVYD